MSIIDFDRVVRYVEDNIKLEHNKIKDEIAIDKAAARQISATISKRTSSPVLTPLQLFGEQVRPLYKQLWNGNKWN